MVEFDWGAPWLQHLCRALDATMGGFLEIFSDSLSRINRMMDDGWIHFPE